MGLKSACHLPPLTAAIVLCLAFFAGCDGKKGSAQDSRPEVYTNMMEDAAFVDGLKVQRAEGTKVNVERQKVRAQMEALVAEAKKNLQAAGAEDPSDDAVKAELEGNPERYPEWKRLHGEISELNGKYRNNQAKLREMARARMAQEARDRKAVETGAARAKGSK